MNTQHTDVNLNCTYFNCAVIHKKEFMGESFKMNENKTLNQEKHQDQERYTTMNMLSFRESNTQSGKFKHKKNKYIEREKGWKKEIKIKRYDENRIKGGKCRTKEVNKRKIKNVQTEDR